MPISEKVHILLTEPVNEAIIDRLRAKFELQIGQRGQFDTKAGFLEHAHPKTAGILSMLSNPIDAEVMQALPNLKIVANNAVGYNNIDIEAAKKHQIAVTNTPDVLTKTTADGAMTLMLATVRNVVAADNDTRMGKFDGWHPTKFCGLELSGAKLGIFGMGRIGQAIAQRAAAFDMHIGYTNRKQIDSKLSFETTFFATILELAEWCDVLMLSCPLSEQTFHAVGQTVLENLGPDGYLINISRGAVVDENTLAAFAKDQKLAGIGLDVYELEPKIHPDLFGAENVTLLPHIASATHKTRNKMLTMCAEAIEQCLIAQDLSKISYRLC